MIIHFGIVIMLSTTIMNSVMFCVSASKKICCITKISSYSVTYGPLIYLKYRILFAQIKVLIRINLVKFVMICTFLGNT